MIDDAIAMQDDTDEDTITAVTAMKILLQLQTTRQQLSNMTKGTGPVPVPVRAGDIATDMDAVIAATDMDVIIAVIDITLVDQTPRNLFNPRNVFTKLFS